MALSDAERERVRYHLGYLSVAPAAALQLGLPAPVQTLFVVENAMNNLLVVGEDRVRRMLGTLDGIECRLIDAQDRLAATSLDDLHLNPNEPDALEREYDRWANRLANQLGCPLYPYAKRFSGVRAGNVQVMRS